MNEKISVKNEKKKKKSDAEPEMGYCPLSIRQGVGQSMQARRPVGEQGVLVHRLGV